MSRRHLIKAYIPPESKIFKTHAAAITAAKACGAPNTSVDSLERKGGGFIAVILLRPDQVWMTPSIIERGIQAFDINTWTPSGRKV